MYRVKEVTRLGKQRFAELKEQTEQLNAQKALANIEKDKAKNLLPHDADWATKVSIVPCLSLASLHMD